MLFPDLRIIESELEYMNWVGDRLDILLKTSAAYTDDKIQNNHFNFILYLIGYNNI